MRERKEGKGDKGSVTCHSHYAKLRWYLNISSILQKLKIEKQHKHSLSLSLFFEKKSKSIVNLLRNAYLSISLHPSFSNKLHFRCHILDFHSKYLQLKMFLFEQDALFVQWSRRRRSSITVISRRRTHLHRRTGVLHASRHIALSIRAPGSSEASDIARKRGKEERRKDEKERERRLGERSGRQSQSRYVECVCALVCCRVLYSRLQLSRICMAVSLTEWRFARPADALPPSSLTRSLARSLRGRSLLFAQPTYLPQPGSARDRGPQLWTPHLKPPRHYISLRSPPPRANVSGSG